MKNTPLTTRLIMLLIFVTVVAYFGAQGWRYFTRPELTTPVYVFRAEHTLTLNGFLVRDEEVIDCSEPLVDLTRTEGERVAKGKTVAVVYQNTQALEAEREITALRAQLEQLEYAKTAARDTEAALRLDSEIEKDMIALRASLESGDYTAVETDAASLRTTVLQREFAYRGSDDLDERIESLKGQIDTLSGSVGSGSRRVTAPFSGTYSAVTDGYEGVLTPDVLADITPTEFQRIAPASVGSTVGKLIRGDRWYYAAVIAQSDASGISVGDDFSLAISGVNGSLPVTVYAVSRPEDGKCVLVFTGDRYLSAVTMLREQNAELILESYTGLRVPKNALRIDAEGNSGVYCRIGLTAYFKPVELVYQGEDYCLVRPGEIQAVRDSDLVLYTLRAGDEVIVSASDLYNGKVIEQQ